MVNKINITLLLLVISTVSFAQIRLCNHGLIKSVELYADGNIRAEGFHKNGVKSGKWTHYYKTGQKESTRYYDAKGAPKGTWTYWYEDGQKWNTVGYKKGELNGHWTYWYENGNKWHQLNYNGGEVIGKWTFWFEDGSVIGAGKYEPGSAEEG